jgi:hypothetical protein
MATRMSGTQVVYHEGYDSVSGRLEIRSVECQVLESLHSLLPKVEI